MATTIHPSDSLKSAAGDAKLAKKGGRRKALKDLPASEINAASPAMLQSGKEKRDGSSLMLSPLKETSQDKPSAKGKAGKKASSGGTEMKELQAMLEKLKLEKAEAEEQVRERDELLRRKDKEIEEKGKQQEKLREEVKKLQKVKGFNPTVTIPAIQSLQKEEPKEDDDSKKKRKSKKNKEKDGEGEIIKKPSPAYVLYCKEMWAQVKEANPQAAFGDVTAELGAKWKGLSAEERKPYEERYQQEKEVYLKAVGKEKREKEAMRLLEEEQMQKTAMELLQQYLQFRQEGDKESGASKQKKEKDPLKPKQPMTAFFHYSSQRRAALQGEGKSVPEIAKIAGEEWKRMGEDEKAPFEELARKQKEEYLKQMELYKQKKAEEAEISQKVEEEQKKILKQEALQLLKKKEKTDHIIKKTKEDRKNKKNQNGEKNVDPNKPKKPASSFLMFSKEQRKTLMEEKPDLQTSTLNALISVRWKELPEAERQVWNDKAAQAMESYKKEMETYKSDAVTK